MGKMKQLAIEMAEAKGLTFEEYMSDKRTPEEWDEAYQELNDDWEPDFSGGSDVRELRSLWKALK